MLRFSLPPNLSVLAHDHPDSVSILFDKLVDCSITAPHCLVTSATFLDTVAIVGGVALPALALPLALLPALTLPFATGDAIGLPPLLFTIGGLATFGEAAIGGCFGSGCVASHATGAGGTAAAGLGGGALLSGVAIGLGAIGAALDEAALLAIGLALPSFSGLRSVRTFCQVFLLSRLSSSIS
eukprot:5684459-Pyramimonas_sp.AAC.1